MSRRIALISAAIAAILVAAVPLAVARTTTTRAGVLRMTRHFDKHALRGRRLAHLAAASRGTTGASLPTINAAGFGPVGFSSEVTVGTGPTDSTPTNLRTDDCIEFYGKASKTGYSNILSTCYGSLKSAVIFTKTKPYPAPTSIPYGPKTTGHSLKCRQYDPLDTSKTIPGVGYEITFKSGVFGEACVSRAILG